MVIGIVYIILLGNNFFELVNINSYYVNGSFVFGEVFVFGWYGRVGLGWSGCFFVVFFVCCIGGRSGWLCGCFFLLFFGIVVLDKRLNFFKIY